MDNEDTNYTKQTTQQIDKYCLGIYSIIHNNNIRCYSSLHRKEFECMGYEYESTKWIWLYLSESLTHGLSINIEVQNQLPDVQSAQTNSDS